MKFFILKNAFFWGGEGGQRGEEEDLFPPNKLQEYLETDKHRLVDNKLENNTFGTFSSFLSYCP